MAIAVLLLRSPSASREPLGRSRRRPAPGSASSAPRDVRLWQHLVAPGVTSSEKTEISTASQGVIILSDRAPCAARLGSSRGTAGLLWDGQQKGSSAPSPGASLEPRSFLHC